MDTFEYCTVRLEVRVAKKPPTSPYYDSEAWQQWFKDSKAVVSIEGNNPQIFEIDDALGLFDQGYIKTNSLYLKKPPLTHLLPFFNKLGQEGWETVEYKSSPKDDFGEALFKRKIQKE